jgi:RHS repeat-associated protein
MNRTTTWAYAPGSTTITDPAGHVSLQDYVGHRLVSVTNGYATPQAATWTYSFDPLTLGIASLKDPNGDATSYTWDSQGNLLSWAGPLNRTASYTYNRFGEPLSVTDPSNSTTTFSYDANGNLLSRSTPVIDPSGYEAYGVQVMTSTYGDPTHPGDITSVTDPNGQVWTATYDTHGNLASAADPLGDTTLYCHDGIGRQTAQISPKGFAAGVTCSTPNPTYTTGTVFNAFGDPLMVSDPLGHQTVYTYDGNRNVIGMKDGLNQTTTYRYDADNEVTETVRPDGTTVQTSYDPDGKLIAEVNGLGVTTTTQSYDALERLASSADALGRTTAYAYDPVGNLVGEQAPGGNCTAAPAVACTTMTYDAANQLTAINYSDGKTPSEGFDYDNNGRRVGMWTSGGLLSGTQTNSTYDSLGRLTSEVQVEGQTVPSIALVNYGYDLAGHLTSIDNTGDHAASPVSVWTPLALGTLTRTYDAAGRMHSVTGWTGNTTTFGYDANSNLTSIAYPNGTNATYSYDAADHTTAVVDTAPLTGSFLNLSYTDDADGRIATGTATGTPPSTQSYGYDPVGRLASSSLTGTLSSSTKSWNYDAADRLIQMAVPGQTTTTLGYDAADELTNTSTTSAAGTSTGTYSYDVTGNRTKLTSVDALGNASTTTYSYDQNNRLTSYTGPAVGAAAGGALTQSSYAYQADGLRADMAWNRAEGLPLILSSPIQVPGGLQEYVTGPGGRLVEIDLLPMTSPNATVGGSGSVVTQTVYVHADAMGSTRVITDATGQPVIGYTYDPYGQATLTKLSASTTPIVNPFLYQGQYVDAMTGLIYLRSRWYDPTTAQFLTKDPLVAYTRSTYGYAQGDPVNGSDPGGLCPSGCPPGVTTLSEWLGIGDIIEAGYGVITGNPSLSQGAKGSLSALEQVATFFLQKYALKKGALVAADILAPEFMIPLTAAATTWDLLCTYGG